MDTVVSTEYPKVVHLPHEAVAAIERNIIEYRYYVVDHVHDTMLGGSSIKDRSIMDRANAACDRVLESIQRDSGSILVMWMDELLVLYWAMYRQRLSDKQWNASFFDDPLKILIRLYRGQS